MRPHEIDYSDTRKHYFDVSNGEVLAGRDDRDRYVAAGADPEQIVKIGVLLRSPEEHLDLEVGRYEPLNTADWPHNRYIAFARWLHRVVEPPQSPQGKKVNKTVFRHARLLGVGPSTHAIRGEFGNYSGLYREAHLSDTHAVGTIDEWDVSDAVTYIKRMSDEKPPTIDDLRLRNKANPNHPAAELLDDRFREIGGFGGLVELAGYAFVERWGRDEYIDWGVRFMRANDGQVPTARMADYLSQRSYGPAASTIINHFDLISNFQAEVIPRYYEYKKEAEAHDRDQLHKIEADLEECAVPLELFSPFEPLDMDEADDERLAELSQELERLYGSKKASSLVDQLGVRETIVRYAKFKVLGEVAPWLETETKIRISRGLHDRSFISAIRKSWPIPPGDIEYAALVEGFFDYIWPDDERVEVLRLDEGFQKYRDGLEAADRERRRAKRQVAAA